MHVRPSRAATLALLLALAVGATGCVVREPGGEIVATQAPPPPRVEVVPVAPRGPEFVEWEPGHWHWNGREYRWVPGHWDERPNGRWVWIGPHWR